MRKRIMFAVCLVCFLSFSVQPSFADRAHELAKKAAKVEAETCEDVQTSEDCHSTYPAGCSDSENPHYDAYLNFFKNQVPSPQLQPTQFLVQDDFESLDKNTPETLKKGNHAVHAEELAELREGNIVALIGYLYYAQVTTSPETTNCRLKGRGNSDYHIGIGFDSAVAKKILNREPVDKDELNQSSIIVEMTPHYRAKYHPKWTIARVKDATGRQVKVMGQLMIDNEHANPRQNCGSPEADKGTCWRASAWEIHPVTQFYVCKTEIPCTKDSPDWKKIDDGP